MMSGKGLILGCAATGAKFTPNNHRPTGNSVLDSICIGASIKSAVPEVIEEAERLYAAGCRYYHFHARNPLTREQTTDNDIYRAVSQGVQLRCPGMMLSFGASRNGSEVRESINKFGEWERVSQCALPLHLGGAHFVTIQAAVELQVICELERRYGELSPEFIGSPEFRNIIRDYEPSATASDARLDSYSTSGGGDYGRTSPLIQFQVYGNAIKARRRLQLLHEIEWVQFLRSYAMSRFAIEHPALGLGNSGQLNITLLFGFSPRLPFPSTYEEFRRVVRAAKSLEYDLADPRVRRRKTTISVGAAILPQQADEHVQDLDVGPRAGTRVCAMRRLAAYAAQPDSDVDILRVGMEDTPYAVDLTKGVMISDNVDLLARARNEMELNGARPVLEPSAVSERLALNLVGHSLLSDLRRFPLGEIERESAVAGHHVYLAP
jgi:hypothetical protein